MSHWNEEKKSESWGPHSRTGTPVLYKTIFKCVQAKACLLYAPALGYFPKPESFMLDVAWRVNVGLAMGSQKLQAPILIHADHHQR